MTSDEPPTFLACPEPEAHCYAEGIKGFKEKGRPKFSDSDDTDGKEFGGPQS